MKKNNNVLLHNRQIIPNIEIDSDKKRIEFQMALHGNYSIRWKNFKGFTDTDWIEIKPITVIIGPNNSGKTSLIAPLLLMNQTITSVDASTPLIISGKVYEGGNIRELLNNYDLNNKEISFGFKYHVHDLPKNAKNPRYYMPGAFEITFGINNTKDREISVISQTIYDIFFRPYIKISKNRFNKYRLSLFPTTKMDIKERVAIRESKPVNFLFSPNSLLSKLKQNKGRNNDRSVKSKNFTPDFSELLQELSVNFSMARNIVGDISYLGPIRDNPHRFYELKNIDYPSVGTRGENLAELLNKHLPEIQIELNKWVKKFEFGDKLIFKRLTNSLRQIRFKNNGEKTYTNIANAGFGASQIIPLIVQALVSDVESLTIAEQPEIHLNPKLQGVLAELFVFMAEKDKRIIVETHSEHLLLRLRRLVAEGKIPKEKIAVYFVNKENGKSTIKPIQMNDNGMIPSSEWPKGFFGDTLKESLALVAQQAKNRKVNKK